MNAGAYKYIKYARNYWIPGRQIEKASSPVPVDGSVTVRTEFRDSLMWLMTMLGKTEEEKARKML